MLAQFQLSALSRLPAGKAGQPSAKKAESSKKGFTLIEIMVSIAIIAVLAAVGLVVYSTAQKAGRVSKRVQD